MNDTNTLRTKETAVLDKWEGDVDDDTSFIAERVWLEDGKIVETERWGSNTYIAPFDPVVDPIPTPPSQR